MQVFFLFWNEGIQYTVGLVYLLPSLTLVTLHSTIFTHPPKHALHKQAMYEQMFDLIVERINVALDPSGAEEQGVDLEVDVLSIGESFCLLFVSRRGLV